MLFGVFFDGFILSYNPISIETIKKEKRYTYINYQDARKTISVPLLYMHAYVHKDMKSVYGENKDVN